MAYTLRIGVTQVRQPELPARDIKRDGQNTKVRQERQLPHLSWSDAKQELVPAVGDFEDLGPNKTVDPQVFTVH